MRLARRHLCGEAVTLQDALKVNPLPLKVDHYREGVITVLAESTYGRYGMPDDKIYVAEKEEQSPMPVRVYGSDGVKIWKEPCKHEPELKMRGLKEILELPSNPPLEFVCRHCLVPLKSKGWEEV